jgi:hypothetical protein
VENPGREIASPVGATEADDWTAHPDASGIRNDSACDAVDDSAMPIAASATPTNKRRLRMAPSPRIMLRPARRFHKLFSKAWHDRRAT